MFRSLKSTDDLKRILADARSPYDFYCEGFGNNDSKGCYITTPIIAAGMTRVDGSRNHSLVLEQIQAFDTAEAEGAYIGQINLFQISSFCGPNGLIWGHDVAHSDPQVVPALGENRPPGFHSVFEVEPLLEAGKRLLGTAREKRFPIIPGSLVPAAYKSLSEMGPATLFGGLAIGVPAENRTSAALFMEYVGSTPGLAPQKEVALEKQRILTELLWSVLEIGANHDIQFAAIYVGARALHVEENRLGCILVAVPYLTLARDALTPLLCEAGHETTIDQWESLVSNRFYHCRMQG
ncbi:MAG: histidine decarboxylase, pyruvoyl type [Thermodesulfobacteriota bacterium]